MGSQELIYSVIKRLTRNRRLNLIVIVLGPLSAFGLLLALDARELLASWLFYLLGIAASATLLYLVYRFLSLVSRTSPAEAARVIDDELNSKDRFLTLATAPELDDDARFSALRKQTNDYAAAFSIDDSLGFRLKKSARYSALAAPIFVIAALIILFVYPAPSKSTATALQELSTGYAEKLVDVIESSPELPPPVTEEILELAQALIENDLLDATVEEQLAVAIEKTLEHQEITTEEELEYQFIEPKNEPEPPPPEQLSPPKSSEPQNSAKEDSSKKTSESSEQREGENESESEEGSVTKPSDKPSPSEGEGDQPQTGTGESERGEQPGEKGGEQGGEQPGEQGGEQGGEQPGEQGGEQGGEQPGEQGGKQHRKQAAPGDSPPKDSAKQDSPRSGNGDSGEKDQQPGDNSSGNRMQDSAKDNQSGSKELGNKKEQLAMLEQKLRELEQQIDQQQQEQQQQAGTKEGSKSKPKGSSQSSEKDPNLSKQTEQADPKVGQKPPEGEKASSQANKAGHSQGTEHDSEPRESGDKGNASSDIPKDFPRYSPFDGEGEGSLTSANDELVTVTAPEEEKVRINSLGKEDPTLYKNKAGASARTELGESDYLKPEPDVSKQIQPIPLEYQDLLKER